MAVEFVKAGHDDALSRDRSGYAFTVSGIRQLNVGPPSIENSLNTSQNQEQPWHPGSYLRPGVQGPNVRMLGEDNLTVVQEQPPEVPLRGSLARSGVQGSNVAPPVTNRALTALEQPWHPSSIVGQMPEAPVHPVPPSISDNVIAAAQEQPWHPGSFFWRAQVFIGSTAMSPEMRRLLSTQEQPWHPLPYLLTTERPVTPLAPSIADSVLTIQEQPWHPGLYLNPGVQGPNVGTGISISIRTVQEQPWHPGPYVWEAQVYFASTLMSLEIRRLLTSQEQPWHPGAYLKPGVQGPNVAPPPAICTTTQEQPWHPAPYLLTTERPVTLVPPSIADSAVNVQEQPSHPGPYVRGSFILALVPPSIADTILVVQEQPWHPGVHLRGSFIPALVPPEIADSALNVQEQPFHPGSLLRGQPLPPVQPVAPSIADYLSTTQEQPFHPGPAHTRPGIFVNPLVSPVPPVRSIAITTQEQPPAYVPQTQPGKQGPNVAAEVINRALTSQEQPWHPSSYVRSSQIYVASVLLLSERRQAITAQEQPGHPAPSFLQSKQGPNVAPPLPQVVTRQEQPDRPNETFLRPGKQGPNVAVGIQALLTHVEEITGHPQPFLRSGIIVPPLAAPAVRAAAITTQEQPGHPAPLFGEPLPPVGPQSPSRRQWVTTQEQPYHPGSFTLDGRSFTGRHAAERRQWITWQEQPREAPAFLSACTAPTATFFPPNPDRTLSNDHTRVRTLSNDHVRVRTLSNDHVRVRTLVPLD